MILYVEATGLEKAREMLSHIEHGPERACVRVINAAILAARTAGVKKMREEYTIKASDIKTDMTIKKARFEKLTATLAINDFPIDIMKFKVKVKSQGIFVQVKKASGGILEHSFFVTTGRNPGIFHRVGKERLPIQREFGPAVAQMMGNPMVVEAMDQRSGEVLESRMDHEINQILGSMMG